MAETQKLKKKTALDRVPFGTPEENEYWRTERRVPMPEGVHNSMILADTFRIAWPSLVELTLTQLASMVDLMMVGQLGYTALTAVGLTTQPVFLLISMVIALNVGATALVARYKGAGEQDKANMVLRQSLLMTFTISAIMTALGILFARPLVLFMGALEDTVDDAAAYLTIRMYALVAFSLTATITATLRGVGDSRTAMLYNVVANVVNVIFNYLLIYGHFGFPRLEVAGAAWATIIGQFAAFGMALFAVLKKRKNGYLHLEIRKGFRPDKSTLLSITQIGMPSMVEQLIMRVGIIIFAKTVADLGTMAYATHQVCMNIQALSFMIGNAIAVSSTSLVGQSLGKKRGDMARLYGMKTAEFGLVCSAILMILFFFFGKQIVMLYNDEPEVVRIGGYLMMFVAFTQPFQGVQFILSGALRGAGDTRSIAVISFITVLGIRTVLALLLVKVFHLGLYGAWIAMAADQMVRTALVSIRYGSRKWMLFKLRGENAA